MAKKIRQAEDHQVPIGPGTLRLITNMIQRAATGRGQEKEICRGLDPCCGTGDALVEVTKNLAAVRTAGKLETYGIEANHARAQEANEKLTHIMATDFLHTSIAHESFHILLLHPPGGMEQDRMGNTKRTEILFLQRATQYLVADGGILAFIAPRAIISELARLISTHYQAVGCFDLPEDERGPANKALVMGIRKRLPVSHPEMEDMIRYWVDLGHEKTSLIDSQAKHRTLIPAPPNTYIVETGIKRKILFTNLFSDPWTTQQEAEEKGVWKHPGLTEAFWPKEEVKRIPLMPLREGHIGMLAAAGMLNNIVIPTQDGRRVILKGRTYKEMVKKLDTEDKLVEQEHIRATLTALDLDNGDVQVMKA